jgi:hypothetical protein
VQGITRTHPSAYLELLAGHDGGELWPSAEGRVRSVPVVRNIREDHDPHHDLEGVEQQCARKRTRR